MLLKSLHSLIIGFIWKIGFRYFINCCSFELILVMNCMFYNKKSHIKCIEIVIKHLTKLYNGNNIFINWTFKDISILDHAIINSTLYGNPKYVDILLKYSFNIDKNIEKSIYHVFCNKIMI